jgi:hypothetical protein
MYTQRIAFLEDSLKLIDERIANDTNTDPSSLKEQKSRYMAELSNMRKLQWEHDHDTVDYDDDYR